MVLIEDNAHGLFGRYHGKPLGSFGALSTLSFHETKNISCGEGGALCISDPALVERAEILHTKGTDRSRFLRGLVDKYTWVDVGSSFGLSDLLAAVLWGQLERREAIMVARRLIHQRYQAELAESARQRGWHLPEVPPGREISFHMFTILTRDLAERDALIAFLAERGVSAVFHYVPLHSSAMGRHFGYADGQFPVSENVSRRLVRLPLFTTLGESDQSEVIAAVRAFAVAAPGS